MNKLLLNTGPFSTLILNTLDQCSQQNVLISSQTEIIIGKLATRSCSVGYRIQYREVKKVSVIYYLEGNLTK